MDIGLNFMERWAKQAGKLHLKDMTHLDDHRDLHLPDGWDVFAVREPSKGSGRRRHWGGVGWGGDRHWRQSGVCSTRLQRRGTSLHCVLLARREQLFQSLAKE